MQEISNFLGITFHTFSNLNNSCGDAICLLIQKKNGLVRLAYFASEQQSCCLTIAATSILCQWMEKKSVSTIETEISQVERMLQRQVYQLNNCPQMEVFQDLPSFPHRVECIGLVLRGIKAVLRDH